MPYARHALLVLTGAFFASTSHAAAPPAAISWSPCPVELTGVWPTLGARLTCTRMQVPVDHLAPALGTIDLGVVRVRASRAVERKGAIFFNFGGPGGSPMDALPAMAADWLATDPDDEVIGRRKQLAEHFDLVAVVPRGLRGGWTFECVPGGAAAYEFIPANTDAVNLHKVDDDAAAVAQACRELPFHPYVNSEQNARDMDFVRRALGEDKLNFFGLSYGTWLGAWYASIFPQHVGRMVFDSTMDVTRPYADAIALTLESEDEALTRRVLRPVANDNARYRMGSDMNALRARIRQMHAWTRRVLAPVISTPANFVAAMRIDAWLKAGVNMTRATLERRIARTTFSNDGTANAAIRDAATQLLPALFPSAPPASHDFGTDGDSVHRATLCNDGAWSTSFDEWHALARTNAHRFPTSNGEDVYSGLLCSHWGPRSTRVPDLAVLREAPSLLMVQAEYDHSTPLSGAENMRDTYPNAYLVVATNMERHGVYGFSRTPCVEKAVADYLLDGTLPVTTTTRCVEEAQAGVPQPSPDALHDHTEFWRRMTRW